MRILDIKYTHPSLYEILDHIAYDNGMVNRDNAIESLVIEDHPDHKENLEDYEYQASLLTPGEREELATAEESIQNEICLRYPVKSLHEFLNWWFLEGH